MNNNNSWGQWTISHFKAELCNWDLNKTPDLLIDTFLEMSLKISQILDYEVSQFITRFPDIKVAARIKTEINKRIKLFSKKIIKE